MTFCLYQCLQFHWFKQATVGTDCPHMRFPMLRSGPVGGWWPPLRWPLPQVTSSPPVLPSCQPLHVTRALPPPPKSTGAPFACTPHPSYVVCARQDPWKGPRSPNKCACQHLRRPGIRAGREAVPVEVEAAVELNGDRAARL